MPGRMLRRVRSAAAMMLADHPHVQGLLLGVSLLAVAAAGAPSAWHAVRDLGVLRERVAQPATGDPLSEPGGLDVVVVSSGPAG